MIPDNTKNPGGKKLQGYRRQGHSNRLNLFLLYITAFLVFLNFTSSMTVLPLYILELGGSEFQSGLQNTLFFLAAILMRTYFGPLADIRGRKLPMLIGAAVFATAPLLFWLTSSLWGAWGIVLSRIYQAAGLAAFFSSGSSLVADMAPEGKTGAYISSYRLLMSMSLLIGPAGSLFVIRNFDYPAWFLLGIFLGLLSMVSAAFIKAPFLSLEEGDSSLGRLKTVFKTKVLWQVFQGVTLTAICIGALLTFVAIYISQVTELANPGIFFTFYAVAGILANLNAGRLSDRWGRQAVFWPAIIILGSGFISLLFLPGRPFIMGLSSLLTGIGAASSISVGFAWVIDSVQENLRATALAVLESTIDMSVAMGALLFGLTSGWIGLGTSFGIMGIIVFSSGVALVILQKYSNFT